MSLRERSGPYEVVPMQASHVDEMVEIEHMSHPNPWSLDSFRHELRANPFSRPRVALTLEDAPSVAGYCVLWVVFEHAFIQNVAVHPRHRRCGLATLLVERAIAEARDGGAESVALDARRSNVAAHRLYQSLGFRVAGARKDYYTHPREDALSFERTVTREAEA